MDPFILKEKEFFHLAEWVRMFPDLSVGFTTKNGGKSDQVYESLNMGFHVQDTKETVCDNRLILAEKLDFPLQSWVGAQQTHEVHIKTISKSEKGIGARTYESAFKRTDGFITFERGILLTLCYANCVPFTFCIPNRMRLALLTQAGREQ